MTWWQALLAAGAGLGLFGQRDAVVRHEQGEQIRHEERMTAAARQNAEYRRAAAQLAERQKRAREVAEAQAAREAEERAAVVREIVEKSAPGVEVHNLALDELIEHVKNKVVAEVTSAMDKQVFSGSDVNSAPPRAGGEPDGEPTEADEPDGEA